MKTKLLLLIITLAGFYTARAQTWTQTSAPSTAEWYSVATSADGNKVFAGGTMYYPYIFASTNSGSTWFQTSTPSNHWRSVACSADGNKLVAATDTSLFTSPDAGTTWQSNAQISLSWQNVVSSADGDHLMAVGGGLVLTSTNGGVEWYTNSLPAAISTGHADGACSADGQKMVVLSASGYICISSNGGTSWQLVSNTPDSLWYSVAMSADGKKVIALLQWLSGSNPVATIYTSTNFAQTWVSNNLPLIAWGGATISADGKKMIVSDNYTNVFSTNDGTSWQPGPAGQLGHAGSTIVTSADGGVAYAYPGGLGYAGFGGIYRVSSVVTPTLSITAAGNLSLSWTIPSTNFALQQSSDLSRWSGVTNPPVYNLTNLQNQVALPSTIGHSFFRLATP